MINYIEKGINLHKLISDSGYILKDIDGVWVSSDDVAVQNIIDNYDPLPDAKVEAIDRIKFAASKKSSEIYPFIDPESHQALGLYNFASDLYLSILPDSRNPLSGRLLEFKNIYDVTVSGIADVNTETNWENCKAVADIVILQIEAI